jgi:hypothetical protein
VSKLKQSLSTLNTRYYNGGPISHPKWPYYSSLSKFAQGSVLLPLQGFLPAQFSFFRSHSVKEHITSLFSLAFAENLQFKVIIFGQYNPLFAQQLANSFVIRDTTQIYVQLHRYRCSYMIIKKGTRGYTTNIRIWSPL